MARMREDSFNLIRRGGGRRGRAPFRAVLGLLVFVSVALLALSRLDHSYVRGARTTIAEAMAPVLSEVQAVAEPVRWLIEQARRHGDLSRRVEVLTRENQELESWKWRARELERQLGDLVRTARVVHEEKRPFITARVVATSTGAFVRSAMINAGRAQQVRVGYPVVNGDGLVGRIVDAGQGASRVLLVTDINSRIPVHIDTIETRALMVGDNGAHPRLIFQNDGASIMPGQPVFTSGVGGLFPRGLKIGEVVSTPAGLAVATKANLDSLEYLSVLFFASPALELTDQAGGSATARRAQATPIGGGGPLR
ncbi:MAG: rod shape-determining protein MreC [Hyphomicrobiaceae bacterium]|nr:rod shape-determining protein MreC [Hyphomicrobiaceae bacterium]